MELTRGAVKEELLSGAFEKYRVIAEQLCEEADPFEVAAAAIAYADKLAGGPDDEDEIPEVTPFEKKGRREHGDRGERGFEGASRPRAAFRPEARRGHDAAIYRCRTRSGPEAL